MPDLCARCGHKAKDHCPGGIAHSWWKDEKRQDGRAKRQLVCTTTHCNQPLCSCVAMMKEAAHA